MFHLYMFLFSTLLFFVLTPGILLTIPKKSSKTTVALVHALVFATVWSLTHKCVWYVTEGFDNTVPASTVPASTVPASTVPASNPFTKLLENIDANQIAVNSATKKVLDANADLLARQNAFNYKANEIEIDKNKLIVNDSKTSPDVKTNASNTLINLNDLKSKYISSINIAENAITKANADLNAANASLDASRVEYSKATNDASTIKGNIKTNTVNTSYNEVPQYIAKQKPVNPAIISSANVLSTEFANFAKALSTPY